MEIYDKFQRAASIKRKLSSELSLNMNPEMTMPRRALSVNFNDERGEKEAGLPTLTRNGGLYFNGLGGDPEAGDIIIVEHLK